MPEERDYVLGTTDEEIARPGLQHRVWRPRVLDAWHRAGFTAGQTILDVGCGPGNSTWRLAPRSEPIEEFVATVMATWRDNGGEPDVGLDLPRWLSDLGFTITEARPIIDVVSRTDPIWEWPAAFLEVNLGLLVATGRLTEDRAERMRTAFREASERPGTYMITPAVIEIIARRR